jgi:hypothetical protein
LETGGVAFPEEPVVIESSTPLPRSASPPSNVSNQVERDLDEDMDLDDDEIQFVSESRSTPYSSMRSSNREVPPNRTFAQHIPFATGNDFLYGTSLSKITSYLQMWGADTIFLAQANTEFTSILDAISATLGATRSPANPFSQTSSSFVTGTWHIQIIVICTLA